MTISGYKVYFTFFQKFNIELKESESMSLSTYRSQGLSVDVALKLHKSSDEVGKPCRSNMSRPKHQGILWQIFYLLRIIINITAKNSLVLDITFIDLAFGNCCKTEQNYVHGLDNVNHKIKNWSYFACEALNFSCMK